MQTKQYLGGRSGGFKVALGGFALVSMLSLIGVGPFGARTASAQSFVPQGLVGAPPCNDPDMPEQANVPCQGIVQFKAGTSAGQRAQIVKGHGAQLKHNFKYANAAAVNIADASTVAALESDSNVLRVLPDRAVHKIAKPDNPGNGNGKNKDNEPAPQEVGSGVARIGAAPGSLPVSGDGVGVAIADTGLDFAHADLNVAPECFSAYGSCGDQDGHGTHVGGIVAAIDNEQDTVGVASDATLYAVRVLNQNGSGTDSTIMQGLEWVADNANSVNPPIRVVNLSLGREGELDDNPLLHQAVQRLTDDLGISVVVAAGNDQSLEVEDNVPATYPEVMAIASSTAVAGVSQCKYGGSAVDADIASYFTTDGALDPVTGIGVTISAPGAKQENVRRNCFINSVGILSLKMGGGTTRMSGTSMAAPHVAGVVALLFEDEGGPLDPEVVRSMILTGADGIGVLPYDSIAASYSFDGEREGILWVGDLF